MSDDLAKSWDEAKPDGDLSSAWEQAAPEAPARAGPASDAGSLVHDLAVGMLPPKPSPLGHVLSALGVESHPERGGIYQPEQHTSPRQEGESDRDYAIRTAHEGMRDPENFDRVMPAAGLHIASPGYGSAPTPVGNRLAQFAQRKQGEAVADAAAKIGADDAKMMRSETGRLGGYAQDLNREVEWVIRLLDEEKSGAMDPAKRTALEALRQDPSYAQVLNKAADRVLTQAPASAGRVSAQEANLASLKANEPQRISDAIEAATSGKEALSQIKARALRYGLPAAGAALGHAFLGTEGALAGLGLGSLAGAGMRPMLHSLIRMRNNPAVRNTAWSAIEKIANLGGGGSGAPPVARLGPAFATASGTALPVGPGVLGAAGDTAAGQGSGAPAQPGSAPPNAYRDAIPIDAFRRMLEHPAVSGANTGDHR